VKKIPENVVSSALTYGKTKLLIRPELSTLQLPKKIFSFSAPPIKFFQFILEL